MSKTIGLVLLSVLVVGGYLVFNNKKSEDTTTSVSKGVEVKNTNSKKVPFSEFIKNGEAYKCTVNQNVGGADTKGITYVKGGMINGKYETKVQGMEITSNFIVRDGYSYSWNSMMANTGFKSKVIENNSPNKNANMSGTYSFNSEQIGDYDCKPESINDSIFIVPSTITFKEI